MRTAFVLLLLSVAALAGCTEPEDGTEGGGTPTATGTGTGATAATGTGTGNLGTGDAEYQAVYAKCTRHAKAGAGNPHVTIHTNLGDITVEVFVDKVPVTGMNFVKLAENGTYDDSPFHRIITDFMMQGGDHTTGDGRGGAPSPDCSSGGKLPDEYHPDLGHDGKGYLSMANTGRLDSGSSQFFITFRATNYLDGYDASGKAKSCGSPGVSCHSVFGKVTAGLDVVDQVNQQAGSEGGTPRTPVTFQSATVTWP